MKKEGKNWNEIIAAIEVATGEKTKRQTLHSRYPQVEAVMSAVKNEDYGALKESMAVVDADVETQLKELRATFDKQANDVKAKRFSKAAELMEETGTELYPPGAVEKCWKEICANAAAPAAADEA
jgi:hypothetical protein